MSYLGRWLDRFRGAAGTTRLLLAILGILVATTMAAMGLDLSPTAVAVLWAPPAGALLLLVLRWLRFDTGTTAIFLAAYALYLAYLSYTGFVERNYDGLAQVEYIRYLLEHGAYPPSTQCFVCHHPPLYYALSAIPYAFFDRTRVLPPETGLQLFSLALFFVFLIFSVQLVRRFTADVRRIRLAAALVAFWPLSIINSVRVHNDTLVTTLMVIAVYFAVCWHQQNRQRDLLLAGAAVALALLTKSTAYVVVATLFALIGYRLLVSPDRRRQLARAFVVLAMIGVAMVVNKLRMSMSEDQTSPATTSRGVLCQKLLGPACDIYPASWVEDDPSHYLWLDVRRFVAEPYLNYDRDHVRRQNFLNHLVKSSLFGTQYFVDDPETAYALNVKIAKIANALLLGMMGYLLLALAHLDRRRLRGYGVVLLTTALFVAFAVAFGLLLPAPHHCDFRHIFPVLPLVSLAYASAVGFFRVRRPWLGHVGFALAGLLLALSIFYFLPKYEWAVRLMARTVPAELSAYGSVVRDPTSWNKASNLIIEGHNTVEFRVLPERTVSKLDISLDQNDTYEVELVGASETRTIVLGPSPDVRGLARYTPKVEPPVEQVRMARLRVKRGDRIYAMGHFILQ